MGVAYNTALLTILIFAAQLLSVSGANQLKWNFLRPDTLFVPMAKEGSLCQIHGQRLARDFAEYQLWALKMHDSSGKFPSGILNGNVHAYGDYDQCLAIKQDFEDGLETVEGNFCWARAFIEVENSSAIHPRTDAALDLMFSHYATRSTFDKDILFLPSFSPINWAFCVPHSCDYTDVLKAVENGLHRLNATSGITVKVKGKESYCMTAKAKPSIFEKPALPLTILFSVSIMIALVATFIECKYPKKNASKNLWYGLLTAFSFKKTWNIVVDTRPLPNDVPCIHGIRFIFSCLIYLVHSQLFGMMVPFSNRTAIAEGMQSESSLVFRCFWNLVDTFVYISGFLTAYFAVIKLQQGKNISAWKMYFWRFIKFAPLHTILITTVRDYSDAIASGPNYQFPYKHFHDVCQYNYWKSILYVANFDGFDQMCFPSTHQLLTDMQMYLVAPWVIILLWKYSKKTVAATIILILAIQIRKGWIIYSENMLAVLANGAHLAELEKLVNVLYLNPINRLPVYFFGMVAAYLIRTRGQNIKVSKWVIRFGWCLATGSFYFCFFYLRESTKSNYVNDRVDSAIYTTLQPILWSFFITWIVFVCMSGNCGALNTLLSWKGFIPFSRISYSFYLMQLFVIFYNGVTVHIPAHKGPFSLINLNEIFAVLFSSVITTMLYLIAPFEAIDAFSTWRKQRGSKSGSKKKS